MFLNLYRILKSNISILPAVRTRPWMKENPHVFKCGPIANCNSFGWDIVINETVEITWTGEKSKESLTVNNETNLCHSNFGHGILTFVPGYTWHTSPGWSLMVCPIPNSENDVWATMWAIIETDTLKYPFFPSIQFKNPGTWVLDKGTAIARIIPIHQSAVMECKPTIKEEPVDFRSYRAWQTEERNKFMKEKGKGWQKFYHNIAEYPVVRMNKVEDDT